MPLDDLLESIHDPSAQRIMGVVPAVVINNIDALAQGRVQVRFPWILEVEPWARMCAPVAGDGAGIWAIPQVDDEVLVAFANGDIMQPYVLGGLWSLSSAPPAPLPTDATTKRVIKSPFGHTITLDDAAQEIVVEHMAQHRIELTASAIKLSTAGGTASIELTSTGDIKITGTLSVQVKAPQVKLAADVSAQLTGTTVEVSATGPAKLAGALVQIN